MEGSTICVIIQFPLPPTPLTLPPPFPSPLYLKLEGKKLSKKQKIDFSEKSRPSRDLNSQPQNPTDSLALFL